MDDTERQDDEMMNTQEDAQAAAPEEGQGEAEAAPTPQEAPEDVAPVDYSSVPEVHPGQTVRGRVVRIEPDQVLVDVGAKSEGAISLDELSYRRLDSAEGQLSVGDELDVVVLRGETEDGTMRLSKRRADEEKAWEQLTEVMDRDEVLEVPVVEAVKGGLVADVGTRGFIPASQVDRGYVEDLSAYVGQTVRVRIIELDRAKRRVILSRRKVIEQERQAKREETWSTIHEGQVVEGTVKSLTDFGAFIDLGGVDGLLHVSEMSWGRVQHPSEVLSEGQHIRVMVLRLDQERGRISLGLKQVLENPWDNVEEKYPEGSHVKGKVVRLATFGAFVELEPGIDGLIHISQLADHHVVRPQDVVSIGDEVEVLVLRVDPVERRVSLSLKDAGGPPPRQSGDSSGAATIGEMLDDKVKRDLFS